MIFLATVGILFCCAYFARYAAKGLRPPVDAPTPLPRPVPLPTYLGRHRAKALIGESR